MSSSQDGMGDRGARARIAAAARGDEGAVAVTVAIMVVMFIAIAVLVVDLGSVYAERRRLQTAADAAALAGVQDLPLAPGTAVTRAQAYSSLNAPAGAGASVSISSDLAPNDTITVVTSRPSPLYFARVFGMATEQVSATAVARVTSPIGYGSGVMPFGVVATGTTSAANAYGYSWGDPVRLKVDSGDGETGNFDLLSLGGPLGSSWGLSDLRSVISVGGTWFPVMQGQTYNSCPGNKVPTANTLEAWIGGDTHSFTTICPPPDAAGVVHVRTDLDGVGGCHRLILCPIVVHADPTCTDPRHPYDWPQGKSTPMQIIGFAEFFVTAIGRIGPDAYIDGLFVRTVAFSGFVAGPYGSSGQVNYALVR